MNNLTDFWVPLGSVCRQFDLVGNSGRCGPLFRYPLVIPHGRVVSSWKLSTESFSGNCPQPLHPCTQPFWNHPTPLSGWSIHASFSSQLWKFTSVPGLRLGQPGICAAPELQYINLLWPSWSLTPHPPTLLLTASPANCRNLLRVCFWVSLTHDTGTYSSPESLTLQQAHKMTSVDTKSFLSQVEAWIKIQMEQWGDTRTLNPHGFKRAQ